MCAAPNSIYIYIYYETAKSAGGEVKGREGGGEGGEGGDSDAFTKDISDGKKRATTSERVSRN